MAGVDALQLWAMDLVGRMSGREREIVAGTMAMAVIMHVSSCSMQVTPCCYGDPAAERDQSDAGDRVDEMTETHREGDAS